MLYVSIYYNVQKQTKPIYDGKSQGSGYLGEEERDCAWMGPKGTSGTIDVLLLDHGGASMSVFNL